MALPGRTPGPGPPARPEPLRTVYQSLADCPSERPMRLKKYAFGFRSRPPWQAAPDAVPVGGAGAGAGAAAAVRKVAVADQGPVDTESEARTRQNA